MKKIGILFMLMVKLSYSLNFSVYPTRFDVDSKKVGIYEMEVINNTLEPLRIEIFSEEDKEFGEEYNLNEGITIVPKTIFLKPGGSQVSRFRFRPSSKLKDGQYKSNLIFKEIPAEIKTETGVQNQETGLTSNIKFITEMAIPVYSDVGNIIIDGKIKDVQLINKNKNLTIKSKTISNGNSSIHLMYSLNILDTKEEISGTLGCTARNGEKDIDLVLSSKNDLNNKKYTFEIYDESGKIYYKKEGKFTK